MKAQLVWLLVACAACSNGQQQIIKQNVTPDTAVAADAGARPSVAPAVKSPTAAAARPAVRDAGHEVPPPKNDQRAREDAAVRPAQDSGAAASEPACDLSMEDGEIEIAGVRRTYAVHVPAKLETARAVPLLVDLHGLLTHARYQRAHSGFAEQADRAGFVVVYPQALDNAWNLGVADCCGADTAHDDVAFIRALVSKLQQNPCIDAKHSYVVGSDLGGGLAQQLACHASELFAAAVTRDFDLLGLAADSCKPSRPVPILALRSEDDPDLPFDGGEVRLGSGLNTGVRTLGAEASLKRWAELTQCTGEPDTTMPNCQRYTECTDSAEVALCTRASRAAAEDAAAAWAFLQRF